MLLATQADCKPCASVCILTGQTFYERLWFGRLILNMVYRADFTLYYLPFTLLSTFLVLHQYVKHRYSVCKTPFNLVVPRTFSFSHDKAPPKDSELNGFILFIAEINIFLHVGQFTFQWFSLSSMVFLLHIIYGAHRLYSTYGALSFSVMYRPFMSAYSSVC